MDVYMATKPKPDAKAPVDAEPKRRKTDGKPKESGKHNPKKNPNMARRTTPRHDKIIHVIPRQAEALEYRKLGYTYAQIAESLGMGCPQTAWNAVESALKATLQEAADEVRKLELERLDAMFVAAYGNAIKGDLMAQSAVLNIMKRRAALQGLDAPVKTDNKTELSSADGVLVVGPVMSPEEWCAVAKTQQAELTREQG